MAYFWLKLLMDYIHCGDEKVRKLHNEHKTEKIE